MVASVTVNVKPGAPRLRRAPGLDLCRQLPQLPPRRDGTRRTQRQAPPHAGLDEVWVWEAVAAVSSPGAWLAPEMEVGLARRQRVEGERRPQLGLRGSDDEEVRPTATMGYSLGGSGASSASVPVTVVRRRAAGCFSGSMRMGATGVPLAAGRAGAGCSGRCRHHISSITVAHYHQHHHSRSVRSPGPASTLIRRAR